MSDQDSPASNPYQASSTTLSAADIPEELASRSNRLAAAIVDGIIMMLVLLVPLTVTLGGFAAYSLKVQSSFLFHVAVTVLGYVVFLLINGYFLAQSGQSIGKKLVKIKIVRTDGSPATLQQIAIRRLGPVQFAQLVPVLGMIFGLVDVLCIFRESRLCIHDQIADTKVINAR